MGDQSKGPERDGQLARLRHVSVGWASARAILGWTGARSLAMVNLNWKARMGKTLGGLGEAAGAWPLGPRPAMAAAVGGPAGGVSPALADEARRRELGGWMRAMASAWKAGEPRPSPGGAAARGVASRHRRGAGELVGGPLEWA